LHGRFVASSMRSSHNFQVQVVEKSGTLDTKHNFRTLRAPDWGAIYGRFKVAALPPAGQQVEALAVEKQEQNYASRFDLRTLSASDWRVLHGRFVASSMQSSHNLHVQVVEKSGTLDSMQNVRTLRAPDWGTIYGRFKLAAVPPAGRQVEAGAVEQQEQDSPVSKHSFRTLGATDWGLVHCRFKAASATAADQSLDVQMVNRQKLDPLASVRGFRTLSASDWRLIHGRFKLTSAPPAAQRVEVQAVDAKEQDFASRYNLRNFRKPNWEKAREKFKAISMWKRTDRTLR